MQGGGSWTRPPALDLPTESHTISPRADISKIATKIHYCCCYNDFASILKLNQLATKIFPESFKEIVKLPQRIYVKIDLTAQWPVFHTTSDPSIKTHERVFGFFATAKSTQKFVKGLEEVFGLCRKPSLIDSPHKAQSCPYLQMKQCPAPCIGNVSRNHYLTRIVDAIDTAEGKTHIQKDKLITKMKDFSKNMDFESAQTVKKQLDHLSIFEKSEYLWTGDLTKLSILHIDKSPKIQVSGKRNKIQSYAAFLIRYGQVIRLDDFTLDQTVSFCKSLIEEIEQKTCIENLSLLSQQLATIGFFLYRNNPAGLWIDYRKNQKLYTPDKIEKLIRDCFELKKSK